MRFLLQRVLDGKVTIYEWDGKKEKSFEKINKGMVVYVGISKEDLTDYKKKIVRCVEKIWKLKMFQDEKWRINASLEDVKGEILLISNFTLYGSNKKWRQIDFWFSAPYEEAEEIYNELLDELQKRYPTKAWEFWGDMEITSCASGPVNIVWDL